MKPSFFRRLSCEEIVVTSIPVTVLMSRDVMGSQFRAMASMTARCWGVA